MDRSDILVRAVLVMAVFHLEVPVVWAVNA